MNIKIQEGELQSLVEGDLETFRLTAMPMKNILLDVSENVQERSDEVAYVFMTPEGNMMFKNIGGIFQVSSVTGDKQKSVYGHFTRIAELNDINYTCIGFEPIM